GRCLGGLLALVLGVARVATQAGHGHHQEGGQRDGHDQYGTRKRRGSSLAHVSTTALPALPGARPPWACAVGYSRAGWAPPVLTRASGWFKGSRPGTSACV